MLYGTAVLWHSSKKGAIYNTHLDPQSKFKLDEASIPPTRNLLLFVTTSCYRFGMTL